MDATENKHPANIYAKYENKTAREKRNQLLKFRKSHAFVIGINHYPGISAHLLSAVPDAEKLAAVLWDEQGFDQVWLIRDIRGAEFQTLLKWIGKKGKGRMPNPIMPKAITGTTAPNDRKTIEDNPDNRFIRYADSDDPMKIAPEDSFLFYYAGHGKAGEFDQGPSGYLLPSDAKPSKAALQNKSLVPMDDLLTALQGAECRHTFLILDCCFAGKFRYAVKKTRTVTQLELRPMYAERFERYKREAAWQVLVSAGPDQTAADWMGDRADDSSVAGDQKPHSPFALALFEALDGKAEVKPTGKGLGDGVLTASELKLYLYDQVEKKTQEDPEFKAQYPDLFPMQGHLGGEFMFFDPRNPLNFPERKPRNPYKGLQSYEPEDADVFFGRKASVDAAFDYFQQGVVAMVITAPSGQGKSSFARAGLFPKLKNELGFETLLQMRPGQFPKTTFDKLKDLIKPDKKQVLLIDQYEELYTVCTEETQRRDFESDLLELFNKTVKGKNRLKLLITVRSDYEWRVETAEFGKKLVALQGESYTLFRLAPMNLDQLREALVNPALMEAYEFESPQLVDRILQEISYAPGALPLLSLAMKWLFQGVEKIRAETEADVRIFTAKHYGQLGGISGCLSKMADAVYEQFDETHREMMRKILLRMVQLQEGGLVRRRVYLTLTGKATHELDFPNDDQDRICQQVLNALEGTIPGEKLEGINLLLRGTDEEGREFIEPAHDSLINYWPRCLEWIDAFGKDNLALQRQLWRAVEESMRVKANQAPATTGEAQDTGINTKISPFDEHRLWDTNRKLEQLFEQLLKNNQSNQDHPIRATIGRIETALIGKDQEAFREFIKNILAEDGKPDFDALIITGTSGSLLDVLLDQGNHWFNQAEAAFIRKSWENRTQGILQLKRERDEARATALIAVARKLEDKTIALNLALAAHQLSPSYESTLEFMAFQNEPTYQQKFGKYYSMQVKDSVAFSPNGKSILTIHYNEAQLWDIEDKTCQIFESPEGTIVQVVAFSLDGKTILMSYNGTIRLWDIEDKTYQEYKDPSYFEINSAAFSPDGKSFVTNYGSAIRLWNIDDHTCRVFKGHDDKVWSVAFSPDGKSILTGSADKTVRLWNIEDKTCRVFKGHDGIVWSVAFSPDGKSILSGCDDKTVRLWKIENKTCRVFKGHDGIVWSVAFSPDGKSILTGSADNTARLWKIKDKTYRIFKGHDGIVRSVAFSPDGKSILTLGNDKTVRLWKVENKTLQAFKGHDDIVLSVAFSPDGKSILASTAKIVQLWNIDDNTCRVFKGHDDIVLSVTFSPDGKSILTLGNDKTVRLWNIDDQSCLIFEFPDDDFMDWTDIAFSPDGKTFLTAKEFTGNTRLWNIEDQTCRILEGHIGRVLFVAFSTDGKFILKCSEDKIIKLWNIQDNACQMLETHTSSVLFATFSPDGKFILRCIENKTARLWNIEINSLRVHQGHLSMYFSITFSPDGKSILTGNEYKSLPVWPLRQFVEQIFGVVDLYDHRWPVAFAPNGNSILFGYRNKACLWSNFYTECATGAIWNRCYKLNEEERQQYKITWDY